MLAFLDRLRLKTLVAYATSCGIGNSIRFLSKQALNITKLAKTRTPDKLITDLANYKQRKSKLKINKITFICLWGNQKNLIVAR